nr:hypothetical protein [Tanacetum cinerariifolium]
MKEDPRVYVFLCDEKYGYGHVCKGRKPRLYFVEMEEGEEEDIEEKEELQEDDNSGVLVQISMNALAGIADYKTITVAGNIGKRRVHLLLDTCSSHNFMDTAIANKLGCKIWIKKGMQVKVAGKNKVLCNQIVYGLEWKMKNEDFKADMFLMPLGGCDIVLGIQWFNTIGKFESNSRIDNNSKSIDDMKEQMAGLSMQLNQLMNETIKVRDKNEGFDGSTIHNCEFNGGNEAIQHSTPNLGGIIGNPNQYSSRLTKIEFPKSDGEDLKPWLYKVEQFFQLDQIKENAKVPLASIHMYGRALNWHQGYMKNRGHVTPSWEQFVKDLTNRFGEPYDDPMAELMELKHNGDVKKYRDAFDDITRVKVVLFWGFGF